MPTHPPHARLGPSVWWVPLWYKDTLWSSPFPLPSEEVAGFPELCLRGGPWGIWLLPKVPPGSPQGQRHLGKELLLGQGGSVAAWPTPVPVAWGGGWTSVRTGTWGWEVGGELTWSGERSSTEAPHHTSPSHKQQQ